MANQDGGSPIALLVGSTVASVASLSVSTFLVQGIVGGGWDVRRAVTITLPYGLIWGFVGGGVAFILYRRVRPRRMVSRALLSLGAGAVLALVSVAVLDTPSGGGLPEIGALLAAGAVWGVVVGWLGWRVSGRATESLAGQG